MKDVIDKEDISLEKDKISEEVKNNNSEKTVQSKEKADINAEVFKSADGIRLTNNKDEVYIDAESGTFNLSLGYNHKTVVNNLCSQIKKFTHISSHLQKNDIAKLKNTLLAYAPEKIKDGWFRDITGSTANECAIRLAQKATGKNDIISMFLSHHGQTALTTSISGNAFRRKNFNSLSFGGSLKVPGPYCHRCSLRQKASSCNMLCVEIINDFIEYASNGNIAGLIVEPISGNGGNVIPPKGYFKALRKLCNEHKIKLIADEVQTGLGRTGEMYASTKFDIDPDIIVLGKGLGGIGVPAAAVLMRPELNTLEPYEHSFTSGSNMLAVTAAISTVEVIENEKILENVRKNEWILEKGLKTLQEKYSCIGDVRGVGYMWGIELEDKDGNPEVELTNRIVKEAYSKHKMILRSSRYGFGNVVKIRPSLIAGSDDLFEILDRLEKTIKGAVK
jgi:4-aminobutyrate aminotransferase-like enzyme